MPTYYPQLDASGLLAQYPYSSSASFSTVRDDMEMGRRYAFSQIGAGLARFSAEPLYRWPNNYSHLTDAQAETLEDFFDSQAGRFGEFVYLDPGGNLVKRSEDFAHADWEKTSVSVGSSVTDPFGGSLAKTVTGSGNGLAAAVVLPDGDASGFVLCGSVWARSASASTLSIGFIDSGFNVLGNTVWNLPANSWVRIHHTIKLATNSYIRLLIGGFGSWNGARDLFGAQCVPLPGPGEYAKTPGNYGYHAKCRFDTDELAFKHLGPNQISVSAPIAEYF